MRPVKMLMCAALLMGVLAGTLLTASGPSTAARTRRWAATGGTMTATGAALARRRPALVLHRWFELVL